MARQNVPFLSFNRGLISPKALARVDLDRTRLSAAVMTNWLPKTQGAMRLRPGTKYLGSSLSDTGAEFIEFVASTDDTALIELTHQKMRIWVPSDTGRSTGALAFETPANGGLDVPLARPKVDTTVTISDTGWSNTSAGGAFATAAVDAIPAMTDDTTSGVTISSSSEDSFAVDGATRSDWKAADDTTNTSWSDTGLDSPSTLPSWWRVDFGASNTKAITSYSIRAHFNNGDYMPSAWTLERSDDGNTWTAENSQSGVALWAVGERRTYSFGDTGTVEARRYWRLNFTAQPNNVNMLIAEIEFRTGATAQQVKLQGGKRIFNATSTGALARLEKRVMVSDTGTEHSLAITVERGPVTLRVGSSQRDDDYISETSLGTGYHNLALTPQGNFYITLQHDGLVDRIVSALSIGDSGTVELTAPWDAADLDSVRYDQSADVIYVDCDGVRPQKIERRGTGRSWSVVDYAPTNGPFLPSTSSSARMQFGFYFGNATLNSDIPFFTANHVGALIRAFHSGQDGVWRLGADEAVTDAIKVTGINDTGSGASPERRLTIAVSGTWSGSASIERSFDGPEEGFHAAAANVMGDLSASDTGTFSRTINDPDDNVTTWYRVRLASHSSGVAVVTKTYSGGGVTGIARVTGFNSNTSVDVEILSRISDTGVTDNWQEGQWSARRGYPTAVALHEGRLAHAARGSIFLSESDDYEGFDEDAVGDAGPISRTLGSGPVDNIRYLVSLMRLIIGTAGSELTMRSSSLDEPLTPTNSSAKAFSTQGSSGTRALKLDTNAVFVQRSGKRVFMVQGSQSVGDYDISELTLLIPDLLDAGVVSIAVQRQPDTRIHCVLGNGKVAILTYEPREEVLCWSMWETDGSVERAAVLPGTGEDKVYYHVNRTINGSTKRYLERWATEAESEGDSGLSWLADCAKSYTDTGRNAALVDIATHLIGESLVVWSDDTGSIPGVDRSPDVAGVQTTYTPDTGGDITLSVPVHHSVAGLPYTSDWTSTKLAYAAQAGTALAQMKRTDKIAFVLYKTHNNGLFFGNDTGNLDPLPRVTDAGATVDADKIFETFDQAAMPFPGLWDPDARIHLRAKSPRPCTVLAVIPTVQTNEKV